ncbi:MAG: hypothetical protein AAF492_20095, partial [Verrucomicrobiota bacterium]
DVDGEYRFEELVNMRYLLQLCDGSGLLVGLVQTQGADPQPADLTPGMSNLDLDLGFARPALATATADLAVTKEDQGAALLPGNVILYSITVTNLGLSDLSGVVVTDAVPAYTTFAADYSDPGWMCADTNPGAACGFAVGDLATGEGTSVTFAVRVNVNFPLNLTQITNVVFAVDDGTQGADINAMNNMAMETTDILPFRDVTPGVSANFVSWFTNRQTGTLFGDMQLCNLTNKLMIAPFWYVVESNALVHLRNPDGIETNSGYPYIDITAEVVAQLAGVGNGDAVLDPTECVMVTNIEFFSFDRLIPTNRSMFAIWADPPAGYDQDRDGFSNDEELITDTDPTNPNSNLQILDAYQAEGATWICWRGGRRAKQILECSENMIDWIPIFTNHPPTSLTNEVEYVSDKEVLFFRVRAADE